MLSTLLKDDLRFREYRLSVVKDDHIKATLMERIAELRVQLSKIQPATNFSSVAPS